MSKKAGTEGFCYDRQKAGERSLMRCVLKSLRIFSGQ
jgi:hypothetical protein